MASRRVIFAYVLLVCTVGCSSNESATHPAPNAMHPIIYRTDMNSWGLAELPPDAAKAIMIARSFWEVSPHAGHGSPPLTFKAWRSGGGWEVLIIPSDAKGAHVKIDGEWRVGPAGNA
jgi:hypothetical protein